MANAKPLVAIACFCENVLAEADKVISAIRIVDTYEIPPLPPGTALPDGLQGFIVLRGLISLKSGEFVGSGTIGLVMQRTTGERIDMHPAGGWPVVMTGGEQGVNLNIQIPLGVKNFGLLWFDVLWDDEVLTRMPLRLKHGKSPDESTKPS